jgi:hypothetical protein
MNQLSILNQNLIINIHLEWIHPYFILIILGSISRDVPVDTAGQTNIGTQDIFADLLRWIDVIVFFR